MQRHLAPVGCGSAALLQSGANQNYIENSNHHTNNLVPWESGADLRIRDPTTAQTRRAHSHSYPYTPSTMASCISTLNAASAALNSLLTRRQKQKSKSGSRGSSPSSGADAIKKRKATSRKTRLRQEVKPKGQNKSKVALSEEEEARLQELAAEQMLKGNVNILRELGKEGKKERAAREEVRDALG